jgi:hypothetical protein
LSADFFVHTFKFLHVVTFGEKTTVAYAEVTFRLEKYVAAIAAIMPAIPRQSALS